MFKFSTKTIVITLLMALIILATCLVGTPKVYAEGINSKLSTENIKFEYSIFHDKIDKSSSVNTRNFSEEEVTIIDVNLEKVAEYTFNQYSKVFNGEIYAEESITEEQVINKLTTIEEEILSGEYFEGHNINNNQRFVGAFNKDSNWNCIDERKVDVILNYKDKHYGDYSEWRSVFKLNNTMDYDYHAYVNESYIKPDGYKTDYRSEKLVYKFNPTLGAKTELRDYAPKMKWTERSVS